MNFKHLIIPIVTLLLFQRCNSKQEVVQEKEKPSGDTVFVTTAQMQSAGIKTGTIERKAMSSVLEVNGVLDVPPQNMVSVSAMMGGFVLRTKLLQGLQVRKGEEVVALQNPDFITLQQDFLSNKTKLLYLETETSRQSELSSEKVSATKVYQQSLSELNSLKAIQSGLKERLKLLGFDLAQIEKGKVSSELIVRSPIDGNVTQVGINLGKYVQPQDVICEIVNTNHLHAELTVFEQDLPKIKVGQHIHFYLQSEPEKERTAHLYLINKKMNADRTVRVHAHLEEEDKNLIPNMILKAKIEISASVTDVLPQEAVVTWHEKRYVYLQAGTASAFVRKEVETGISHEGFVAVKFPEAVAGDAKFVVKGARDLLSMTENIEEEE